MRPEQDPKYEAWNGRIINRKTRQQIPDDEPIFILRAKDAVAITALLAYEHACTNAEHRQAVTHRIYDFKRFQRAHPEEVKEPDTAYWVKE